MSLIIKYKNLYTVVESIISVADPVALGGAHGEYENQINEIVRLILEKEPISGETLQQIFLRDFADCNVSSLKEFSRIVGKINAKVSLELGQ